jgi:hypothetical protein
LQARGTGCEGRNWCHYHRNSCIIRRKRRIAAQFTPSPSIWQPAKRARVAGGITPSCRGPYPGLNCRPGSHDNRLRRTQMAGILRRGVLGNWGEASLRAVNPGIISTPGGVREIPFRLRNARYRRDRHFRGRPARAAERDAARRGTCRCARISASGRGREAFADATGRAVVFRAELPSPGASLHGQQLYAKSVVAPAVRGGAHGCFA